MTAALWIIAICEIIRILQNAYQLLMVKHDTESRDDTYSEFVRQLLEEIERSDNGKRQ